MGLIEGEGFHPSTIDLEAVPKELVAVRNVGASNVVEMYSVLDWLGFDFGQAIHTDIKGLTGVVLGGLSRMGHKLGSRNTLGIGGRIYNDVLFPLRSRGTLIDGLAQRSFLKDVDKLVSLHGDGVAVLCFHHSTALSLWERHPNLRIFNWVPNVAAFPGEKIYAPLRGGYLGWHEGTLRAIKERVKTRTGEEYNSFCVIDPFVPKQLAENFLEDDGQREAFFKNPDGPLRILFLPSGSGISLKRTMRMIEGLAPGLKEGWIQLTINLWNNTDQAEKLKSKIKEALGPKQGVEILAGPNQYGVYEEVVEEIRKAHLVLAVAGVWPRWADMCGIPSVIFSDFKAGVEKENASFFEGKGQAIASMEEVPAVLRVCEGEAQALAVVSEMNRRIRELKRFIDPLAMSDGATAIMQRFLQG